MVVDKKGKEDALERQRYKVSFSSSFKCSKVSTLSNTKLYHFLFFIRALHKNLHHPCLSFQHSLSTTKTKPTSPPKKLALSSFCPFLPIFLIRPRKKEEKELMWQRQSVESSFRESLKALEADIQHANTLAAALPGDYGGDCVQMRLSYSPFAPIILLLVEWLDYSCTDALPHYLGLLHILVYKVYYDDGIPTLSSKERRASLREFYAIIYPSLKQLEGEFVKVEDNHKRRQGSEALSKNRAEDSRRKVSENDFEEEDECGICMENRAKMIMPNCRHSLCIDCFHDWNLRSQSCPFCRGSLRRVRSGDLWVLIDKDDIIDTVALAKENLKHFYLYIETLPSLMADSHASVFDYMI